MAKSSAPYKYRDGWRIKWIDDFNRRSCDLNSSVRVTSADSEVQLIVAIEACKVLRMREA
jgi:hypothetical protein